MLLKELSSKKDKIEDLFDEVESCTSVNQLNKDDLDDLRNYLGLFDRIKMWLKEAAVRVKKLHPELQRMAKNCNDPDNRKWVPKQYNDGYCQVVCLS